MLRLAVDRDGGVTLDDVAEATRAVSDAIDDAGAMGESPYTLEVTSRGVDRPLTLPRHWRRNHDRLVKVTTTGGETLTGRIGASDDDGVTLDVEGDARTLGYDEVAKALVQIEFNRKPASAKTTRRPDGHRPEHPADAGAGEGDLLRRARRGDRAGAADGVPQDAGGRRRTPASSSTASPGT